MSSTTETNAATSVRVPKLAVRNRTSTTASNNGSDQATSSHSSTRTASPLRDRGTSDASQRSKQSNMESTASVAARRSGSSQEKRTSQQNSNPKKKGGMLGFLTLKEPSTNALELYAEQQRKAAAAKGGQATASSLTVQKLPEHVPKVNSKWDGLPEDARKRLERERKSHDNGSSLFTTSTRGTYRSNNSSSDGSTSTRRPIGTMSSRPSSMNSTVRTGQKFAVIHANYDTTTPIAVNPDPFDMIPPPHPTASHSFDTMTPATPTSASVFSPSTVDDSHLQTARSVRRVSGAVPAELAGKAIAELPGDGPVELPGDEVPQMAGDEPAYTTSPAGGSPLTPPVDYPSRQTPRSMKPGLVMDAHGTMWYSDTDPEDNDGRLSDQEVLASSLPKAFGKRPMMEYIAESPIEYPETPEDWPLPSNAVRVLEAEEAQEAQESDSATPTPIDPTSSAPLPPPTGPLPAVPTQNRTLLAPMSIYNKPGTHRPPSLAPSIATSVAPSVNSSIDWPLPPTAGRLTMATGPAPRKADVAPWERFDDRARGPDGAVTVAKGSAPAPNTAPAPGTKKRFSGILGRR